ncbi:MAG: hypothetical protein V3G42_11645 [Oscillospiraceae bacterium]
MSKKERNSVWLYPETKAMIESHMEQDSCKSVSEYIEKAVKFYTGYLDCNSSCSENYLPIVLTSVVDAIVKGSENRISRNLFKLAVEVGAVTHMQAATCQIDEETLSQLRAMCVNEVRKINGVIRHEDAVKFQQS